jgi:hypothetical protein
MPPPFVRSIREEILYEYAKLISRSAFGKLERAFITDRYKLLRDGKISISDTMREWEQEQQLPRACVFCGSMEELSTDHLIPKNRGGDDSADNLVLACRPCNSSRRDRGVFEWLGLEKKDTLHRLVAGKYLKQLLKLHEAAGTLNITKDDLPGQCANCPLPGVCEEWESVGKLSCFCLESVFTR